MKLKAQYLIWMITALLCLTPLLKARQMRIETLKVEDKVYRKVKILDQTPSSIMIHHSGGITDIPIKKLSPDWQKRLNYQASEAQSYRELKKQQERFYEQRRHTEASRELDLRQANRSPSKGESSERVPRGTKALVDFRPTLKDRGIHPKNQGSQPSCTVFSIVGALECEFARDPRKRHLGPLSEDFLIWATIAYHNKDARALRRTLKSLPNKDFDTGFTLFEVLMALSQYGVVPRSKLRYKEPKSGEDLPDPTASTLADAKRNNNIRAYSIEGDTKSQQIDQIIETLNAGHAVVLGLRWPGYHSLVGTDTLSNQPAKMQHAVTLVGFENPSGAKTDMRFIFRNSWGTDWGDEGYGYITHDYLEKNLLAALFLGIL